MTSLEHADDARGQPRELEQLTLGKLAHELVHAIGQDLDRAAELPSPP